MPVPCKITCIEGSLVATFQKQKSAKSKPKLGPVLRFLVSKIRVPVCVLLVKKRIKNAQNGTQNTDTIFVLVTEIIVFSAFFRGLSTGNNRLSRR